MISIVTLLQSGTFRKPLKAFMPGGGFLIDYIIADGASTDNRWKSYGTMGPWSMEELAGPVPRHPVQMGKRGG
jgi:hypothetical protein